MNSEPHARMDPWRHDRQRRCLLVNLAMSLVSTGLLIAGVYLSHTPWTSNLVALLMCAFGCGGSWGITVLVWPLWRNGA